MKHTDPPVVRVWSGHISVALADGFHQHLLKTGIADALGVEGCFGVTLLRRRESDRVHFTLLTVWRDMDAVRCFAGDSPEGSVLYPGDEAFDLVPELVATHYDLVLEQRANESPHSRFK